MKFCSFFHGIVAEYSIHKRDSVISKPVGTVGCQGIKVGHFFPVKSVGNRGSLINMYFFSLGPCEDIFQGVDRIYNRFGVCHTDYRSKSTFGSSKGTCMQVFFISKPGITKVNMSVYQSGSNDQSGNIQNFFTDGRREIGTDLLDDTVIKTNIHDSICAGCRVYKMSFF